MIVQCTSSIPTPPQAERLGRYYQPGRQEFPVALDHEYLVFGMRIWGQAAWVDIESDAGYLVTVPLCLFRIVDGRVSALWEARVDADGDLSFLPPSFYQEYYIDDLIEGVPEVVRDYLRVRVLLEEEHSRRTESDGRMDPE